jgi:hypothetical protein
MSGLETTYHPLQRLSVEGPELRRSVYPGGVVMLSTNKAMECGRCGHQYPDYQNLYVCPACGAGVPYTHTIYPFRDAVGNIISPGTLKKLRELKIPMADMATREEAIAPLMHALEDAGHVKPESWRGPNP